MQWRAHLLARRAGRSPEDRRRCGERLAAALSAPGPGPVAAYLGLGDEPPTEALLAAWADREVMLPVLRPDGDLDWALADGRRQSGLRGTTEPAGPRLGVDAVAACPLVVVPALAVDRRGVRLGRGGGAYDRALTRVRGRVVVAVYDDELVDRLPEQAHDRRVDAVVLPGRGLVTLPEAAVGRRPAR